MKITELERFLEEKIPVSLRCEWDNDGRMLLPDPERDATRVLIALDATDSVIDRAISGGFDLILTHHPLIFKPLRRLDDRRLLDLLRAGVAVYSYHTRLDAVSGGVNDCLAQTLGIKDTEPFGEDGMGRIGALAEPMEFDAFAAMLKRTLGAPRIEAVKGRKPISRVAVLGGSGKDFINDAISFGADAFVTGEASYNSLLDAAGREMSLFCAGHYHTEQPVCARLAEWVRGACPEIETEIADSCPLTQI